MTIAERPELAGIKLGKKREPRIIFLSALENRGIVITSNTVAQIRGGSMSGGFVEYQIRCARALQLDDSSKKIDFYRKITQDGTCIVEGEQAAGKNISSKGLLAAIAESSGNVSLGYVRCALRAMRVDLVCMAVSEEGVSAAVTESFYQAAQVFIKHKIRDGSECVAKLNEEWKSGTVPAFYRILYGLRSNATIGSFTPYELSVLDRFYSDLQETGHHLTPLDRQALENGLSSLTRIPFLGARAKFAERMRQETGIMIDKTVLAHHRNAILFGAPINPRWKHT